MLYSHSRWLQTFRFRKYIEELYYLCSENIGTDQLCGHRKADLRLCFCIYAKSRFSYDMAEIVFTDCVGGQNEKY